MAGDLEAFARHAKRSNIHPEECVDRLLLFARHIPRSQSHNDGLWACEPAAFGWAHVAIPPWYGGRFGRETVSLAGSTLHCALTLLFDDWLLMRGGLHNR